jgi:hypothetical protein
MNMNPYITKMVATAHTNDLLAAADRHRASALHRDSRHWHLRRRTPTTTPSPTPILTPTRLVLVENAPTEARRQMAGAGAPSCHA